MIDIKYAGTQFWTIDFWCKQKSLLTTYQHAINKMFTIINNFINYYYNVNIYYSSIIIIRNIIDLYLRTGTGNEKKLISKLWENLLEVFNTPGFVSSINLRFSRWYWIYNFNFYGYCGKSSFWPPRAINVRNFDQNHQIFIEWFFWVTECGHSFDMSQVIWT